MKKTVKFTLAAISLTAMAISFTSCASNPPPPAQQQAFAQQQGYQQQSSAPQAIDVVGEQSPMPCFEFDTPEYITGWGNANGSMNQLNDINLAATDNAQDNILQKMERSVMTVNESYRNRYTNGKGSDLSSKMEGASLSAAKNLLKRTGVHCQSNDKQTTNGYLNFYVGYRMYIKEWASQYEKEVGDRLTASEKIDMDFKENQFRERNAELFQEYIKNNKPK